MNVARMDKFMLTVMHASPVGKAHIRYMKIRPDLLLNVGHLAMQALFQQPIPKVLIKCSCQAWARLAGPLQVALEASIPQAAIEKAVPKGYGASKVAC